MVGKSKMAGKMSDVIYGHSLKQSGQHIPGANCPKIYTVADVQRQGIAICLAFSKRSNALK